MKGGPGGGGVVPVQVTNQRYLNRYKEAYKRSQKNRGGARVTQPNAFAQLKKN